MDIETYELVIGILGLLLTILVSGFVFFANQANKRANANVPPEVANTLADLVSPDVLKLLIVLVGAGKELAKHTTTTVDDELLATIDKQLIKTPAPVLPADPDAQG